MKVQPPTVEECGTFKEGATLISLLQPYTKAGRFQALAARKVTAFAMELMPRITRAQSMDALSAMSTVSGYKAVLIAANHLPKFFPLLMTAAGTVTPARVFIIGAGVAGLQAIGTAQRLGAVVEAYDTRPVVKEQVESLGAKFVELGLETEGRGGQDGLRQGPVRGILPAAAGGNGPLRGRGRCRHHDGPRSRSTCPRADYRGNGPGMRPGSVIVDLAAEQGGNCASRSRARRW